LSRIVVVSRYAYLLLIVLSSQQSGQMMWHMTRRDVLHYEVRGLWDGRSGGKIRLPGLFDLRFDTPKAFGGLGRYACADQLFLSSLAACLIGTFLYFKGKMRFGPVHVEASVKARLVLAKDRGYRFSNIKAVLLVLSRKEDMIIAKRCGDLAVSYCHLTQTAGAILPLTVKSRVKLT